MSLYELHERPELDAPILVMTLEGWIDAGAGGANAAAHLLETLSPTVLATFDTDLLLDYRARRPVMHIEDGVSTNLAWTDIRLLAAKDAAGKDLLLLVGAEPDHAWRAFSGEVVQLAGEFGARMVVGLGAYPAAAPHTRPVKLACTAATAELARAMPFVRGSLDVPAGIHAAIEREAGESGIPAIGLWAQVPHYAAAMPYPAASAALVDGLGRLTGLALDAAGLHQEAIEASGRLDALVAESDEHQELVRQLEAHTDTEDEAPDESPLEMQSGDEIAAEFERFLRDQDG